MQDFHFADLYLDLVLSVYKVSASPLVLTLRDLDPQQKLQFQLLIRILGNRN